MQKGTNQRKNRSKLEVAADILGVAKNGSRKTRIMYQANLSFELLQKYLEYLTKAGLLETVGGKEKSYVATDKGKRFLEGYYEVQRYAAVAESMRRALVRDLEAKEPRN